MNTIIEHLWPLAIICNGRGLSLGSVLEAADLLLADDVAPFLTGRAINTICHFQGQFQLGRVSLLNNAVRA